MVLSILVREIYAVLRVRVPVAPAEKCKIRYRALVEALPPLPSEFAHLYWHDPRLDAALGQLVTACRARGLPAISAMVVNDTGCPGNLYYPVAHPGVRGPERQTIAWFHELEAVAAQTYPALNAAGELS